jgi:drug/metabolite transporter (DMT)-like permease
VPFQDRDFGRQVKGIVLNWYVYSLMALVLMGSQRFLYKVSAELNCNTAWTTFSFMAVVTVISAALFALSRESVPSLPFLVAVAAANSISFVLATMSHMEALKRLAGSVVYPVIRLNAVLVAIFSVIFFEDRLSGFQIAGIAVAMAAVVFLTRDEDGREPTSRQARQGFLFVSVSLLGGAAASISSKFAAMHTSKLAFMALAYLMGTLFSLAFRTRLATAGEPKNRRKALQIGLAMGLINFFGFYAFLKALSLGPLSMVVTITAMHFVIAVLLSALIYRERLTPLRISGVVLTMVSVMLLRL